LSGEAQGTYYSIIYFDDEKRDFQHEIDSILRGFDQSVSLWVPNSIISKVNRNDTSVVLDNYFIENFSLAKEIAEETDGAFDLTVGSLVRAWGFGFDAEKKVDEGIIDSILQFTGYKKVALQNGKVIRSDVRTTFDFNAVAQGYSVDQLGMYLENMGIDNYLVDIGGEVRGRGKKPDGSSWKVGIEKPAFEADDSRDLKAVIALDDKSIATSGNYRKFYEENGLKYSHTIDPTTGYPVRHSLLSVSVLAENTAIADGYATAFMVMGLEKAKAHLNLNPELQAFFIYSAPDGSYKTYQTDGFNEVITRKFE
jgi:thiamine biosynthesis lipoprotein